MDSVISLTMETMVSLSVIGFGMKPFYADAFFLLGPRGQLAESINVWGWRVWCALPCLLHVGAIQLLDCGNLSDESKLHYQIFAKSRMLPEASQLGIRQCWLSLPELLTIFPSGIFQLNRGPRGTKEI